MSNLLEPINEYILRKICDSDDLPELGKFPFKIIYKGNLLQPAILIRFKGKVYAYVNRCLHMSRRLDTEDPNIFDETGSYLRCSVHGVCYSPTTGEGYSPICLGQGLTTLMVEETENGIFLQDEYATLYSEVPLQLTITENGRSVLLVQDEYSYIHNAD